MAGYTIFKKLQFAGFNFSCQISHFFQVLLLINRIIRSETSQNFKFYALFLAFLICISAHIPLDLVFWKKIIGILVRFFKNYF